MNGFLLSGLLGISLSANFIESRRNSFQSTVNISQLFPVGFTFLIKFLTRIVFLHSFVNQVVCIISLIHKAAIFRNLFSQLREGAEYLMKLVEILQDSR